MKIARFEYEGEIYGGIVEDGKVFFMEVASEEEVEQGSSLGGLKKSANSVDLNEVKILSPVMPSKIVAIGLNYKAHAAEFNKELPESPMLILKPNTAVIAHGEYIELPPEEVTHRVDYEGELGVVIARKCRNISKDEAKDYILGYTCFNDVTARDLQKKDVQYTRAKGFDTFAPIGPFIETDLANPNDVMIETYHNGEKKQSTSTNDMVFDVFELVSFVSSVMTLNAGDVIATGTPSGVGKIRKGDEVEVRIEGVGSLVNTVR